MENTSSLSIWYTFKESLFGIRERLSMLIKGGLLSACFIAITFILSFLLIGISFGLGPNSLFNEITSQIALNNSFSISLVPETVFQKIVFTIVTILLSLVSMYVVSRYVAFVTLALTLKEKTFKELLNLSKDKTIKLLGLLFVVSSMVTFTTIPFVIPGIIYVFALSLSVFPIILENKGIKESLMYSSKVTKGEKGKIFVLFLLISFVGFITQILLMLYSTITLVVFEAINKSIQSNLLMLLFFALFFILVALGFVVFAVFNTILPIAVLQKVFDELRKKDITNVKGIRVWAICIWFVIGLLFFSGIFLLAREGSINQKKRLEKAYALNDLNTMKLKGYRSELVTNIFTKGYINYIESNDKMLKVYTGYNRYTGNGLDFNYPAEWQYDDSNTEASNMFAQFRFEKNTSDLGLVKFKYNIELDPLVTWDPNEFLKIYGVPKLDDEVKNGGIQSYKISKFEGVQHVTILDIIQELNGVISKEREYFWFIGPNKYTIGIFGKDNRAFENAVKEVEMIIRNAKLHPMIQNYPEIYR